MEELQRLVLLLSVSEAAKAKSSLFIGRSTRQQTDPPTKEGLVIILEEVLKSHLAHPLFHTARMT